MKKVIALALAILLLITFSQFVYAGGISGIKGDHKPYGDIVNRQIPKGGSISIPLGASAFTYTDATPAISDIDQAQLNRLKLDVNFGNQDQLNDFKRMFDYQAVTFTKNTSDTTFPVVVTIKSKYLTNNTTFNFQLGLAFTDSTGAYTSRTNSDQTFQFSGTIEGAGALLSFNQQSAPPSRAEIMDVGSTYLYPIRPDLFVFASDAPNVVTLQNVFDYGLTAHSSNPNFTTLVVRQDDHPYVQVIPKAGITPGFYTTAITMQSTQLSGTPILLNMEITIPLPTVSAVNNRITGIDPDARLGYTNNGIWSQVSRNGTLLGPNEHVENLDLRPGDELAFQFNSNFFEWRDGKPYPPVMVTSSMLKNGKITAKIKSGKNRNLVQAVEIKSSGGQAYLWVKFVDHFISVKDKEVDVEISLAYNGSFNKDCAINVGGIMENPYVSLYDGDDYFDLSYGDIAVAEETIKNIELYLGHGVTAKTRMLKDKKYYGTVSIDPTYADIDLMDQYHDIEMVYTLNTVGLNSASTKISIDAGGYRYYIYNSNREYLGTTKDLLPYSTKYYLATKEIDFIKTEKSSKDPDTDIDEPSIPDKNTTPPRYTPQQPNGSTPGGAGGPSSPGIGENYNPMNGR